MGEEFSQERGRTKARDGRWEEERDGDELIDDGSR